MKRKTICALAVVAAAVFTAVRVWQYLWIINVSTGFFTDIDGSVYLLYGGLAVFFVLAALTSFFDKTIAQARTSFLNSRLTGVGLLLAGGTNLFASAFMLAGIMDGRTIKLVTASEALLGFASALVLLYFGVLTVGKREIRHKFLPLVPLVWVVIRLLNEFRRTSTVLTISENLLLLLSLVALCIYFMYFAFAVAGLFSKTGARWLFLSSVVGVALLVPATLGMLIAASANAFYTLEPIWYIERIALLCLAPLMLSTAYFTAFEKQQTANPAVPTPEVVEGDTAAN